MIDADLAFEHHFFKISGAEGICRVPAHTGQDDLWWKMRAFEANGHGRSLAIPDESSRVIIPQIDREWKMRQNCFFLPYAMEGFMPRAYISGTGMYVPERVVTNQELVEQYGIGTTHNWIVQRSGIEERRFADEGIGTSDLAAQAAAEAISSAGLSKSDIDMILFCTLSPEHAFPGAGVYMQDKLGMHGVPAMDIRNQCSGFLYGLGTATSMVESGAVHHVLLIGAELHSHGIDMSTRGRTVACLFGDGAGAVVVSATVEERGVRWWKLGADGKYADVLCQKVWDNRKNPYITVDEAGRGIVPADHLWPQMQGKVVFKHAVEKMTASLMELCVDNSLDVSDLDLLFFHQANLRINQFILQQLDLPEDKAPSNIQKYGNTTAATIPMLLAECQRDGRLQRGMKVACVAFGSGFTWGGALLEW
jgi:3-oxoacyl-[acyl-carrier-protein] synthase-3